MKNTATITQPVTESSHQQVIAKAEQEITRLETQQRTITLKLQADNAEIQALAVQATAHAQERDIAQRTIDQRRKALREAEAQCELASGTLASKPDVKPLEKLLKQAQSEQMVILDRVQKAEQAEDRRRIALSEAIDRHQRDLTQLAERKAAMVATKERVFAEQGESLYQARLEKLGELQRALNEQEQVLQMIRQDIERFSSFALESLNNWAELKNRLSHALPFHNPTTEALKAAIGLMDILLTSNHKIERLDTALLREAGIHYRDLEHLLSWPTEALYPVLYTTESGPVTLQQNKIDLNKVLELYVAHKKEVRG